MRLKITEQELQRYNRALNMMFNGAAGGDASDELEKRLKSGGQLSDEEKSQMLFMIAARRIIEKRQVEVEQEKAILRAYDKWQNAIEASAFIKEHFRRQRELANKRAAKSGEQSNPANPDEEKITPSQTVYATIEAIETRYEFIISLLDYFEQEGTLPDSLRRPPPSDGDDAVPEVEVIKEALATLEERSRNQAGFNGFNSSPFNGFAVGALARTAEWTPDIASGYTHSLYQERADKDGYKSTALFGIRGSGQSAPNMGELLAKRGPVAVKAWYGLWALWSEEGSDPTKSVTVDLNGFCDALGYHKHHKGGHRIEAKQEAVQILDFITQVEMMTTIPHYDLRKRKAGKVIRLSGRIWERGVLAEEGYADLFGQAGIGESSMWEPIAFRYRPGEWFRDADFRVRHARIGYIGAGLLKLANDKDQWAILIGGYLGWKGDVDKHETHPIRAETILQAVGLAQSSDAKRRGAQMRDKFERALDRLREVGVVTDWTWAGIDVAEPDDLNDVASLADYAADTSMVWKGGEWRRKFVLITWPKLLEEHGRLRKAKRQEYVKTAKANRARLTARNIAKQESA